MTSKEWRQKYIRCLIEDYGFTKDEAEDMYKAGDSHDYDECPESAVSEEMSYWGN